MLCPVTDSVTDAISDSELTLLKSNQFSDTLTSFAMTTVSKIQGPVVARGQDKVHN